MKQPPVSALYGPFPDPSRPIELERETIRGQGRRHPSIIRLRHRVGAGPTPDPYSELLSPFEALSLLARQE